MGTTSAYFNSLGKEPVPRQLLKFLERNSAKNNPDLWIIVAGMSSDLKNFLCLIF